ncbi:MAG: hypothetical protein J7480_05480 [Microbacteriaceae bacterium]|nr:hypothetical protein [Microbacteriaceae bacterium]
MSLPAARPGAFSALLASAAIASSLLLTACGTTAPPAAAPDAPVDAPAEAPAAGGGTVLPGDGSYVIGVDAPYGGYRLVGDPDALPAGCEWSIDDGEGSVVDSNGLYAFLTDVPEYVNFVTSGCPDWEQFE